MASKKKHLWLLTGGLRFNKKKLYFIHAKKSKNHPVFLKRKNNNNQILEEAKTQSAF